MESMELSEFEQQKILLQKNGLFAGIDEKALKAIISRVTIREVLAQEFIILEEELAGDEFYLIKSGEVEILKHASNCSEPDFHRITTLSVGETIGEVALLENVQRTASARALTPTTLLVLSISAIREISSHQQHYAAIINKLELLQAELAQTPSYAQLALNLAKGLSQRLHNTNLITAEALQHELHSSQLQVTTGKFLLLIITGMVIYAYALAAIGSLAKVLPSTTYLTVPNMILFSTLIIYFVITTGYPLSFFGLSLNNWRKNALEGVLWSIPVMALIVLMKLMSIHFFNFNLPLFEGPAGTFQGLSTTMIVLLILVYLILTPLQEFLARGVIQSALQHFLDGKHRLLAATIVSNLIFGMVHLHMSFSIGIVVLVFGLFLGGDVCPTRYISWRVTLPSTNWWLGILYRRSETYIPLQYLSYFELTSFFLYSYQQTNKWSLR